MDARLANRQMIRLGQIRCGNQITLTQRNYHLYCSNISHPKYKIMLMYISLSFLENSTHSSHIALRKQQTSEKHLV
jgi:hypothetical protein